MYIIDYDKQISLINEMKQLRKDDETCEVYYHHPYTNQMWKGFFPRSTEDELGPKLLRHEPPPTDMTERLQVCLGEAVPENAIGLGIEWSSKPELWPSIIEVLEKRYSNYNRKQLKLFLNNLQLDEAKDQLPEKNDAEDHSDQQLFADQVGNLIWRSRKIRMKRFFVLG
ncbi:hypothetical protein LX73_2281 [Fodinibius salinus]|uniref:Uncharacterized protein n=1 Tax=Fodinibius salinus TaxID=860790 RepID=A0A5D3YFP0_9BACT|nr:hypothetical protein [Fodinibius salinus]TYP92035.1 hypothetical protein LX73_2281 [Fodinibius salinus]